MAIAIFSTWTTYGTWLPGDQRGWFKRGQGSQDPNPLLEFAAALQMSQHAVTLTPEHRRIVEATIAAHCEIRKWSLHAVNCRSNHVHAVVSASERSIVIPREQFKAWCTRKLMEYERLSYPDGQPFRRVHWWTERGWDEFIDDENSLAEVTGYVLERQ